MTVFSFPPLWHWWRSTQWLSKNWQSLYHNSLLFTSFVDKPALVSLITHTPPRLNLLHYQHTEGFYPLSLLSLVIIRSQLGCTRELLRKLPGCTQDVWQGLEGTENKLTWRKILIWTRISMAPFWNITQLHYPPCRIVLPQPNVRHSSRQ